MSFRQTVADGQVRRLLHGAPTAVKLFSNHSPRWLKPFLNATASPVMANILSDGHPPVSPQSGFAQSFPTDRNSTCALHSHHRLVHSPQHPQCCYVHHGWFALSGAATVLFFTAPLRYQVHWFQACSQVHVTVHCGSVHGVLQFKTCHWNTTSAAVVLPLQSVTIMCINATGLDLTTEYLIPNQMNKQHQKTITHL